ncbi:YdbC family protein [Evansella halocellulosilytica]|uniref:YdbC family protein n=1 Tax=Evansella halocellulosilytica TaxID=2011013 RepID=UPI000BB6F470|nr:YdbC family protein [Evansella halocellulosilytica]
MVIIKRITCDVKEDQKLEFYEYQKQWKPLSDVQGFLGQIGGWNKKDPLKACIYSFWQSETDYQHFMREIHDDMFVSSGQEETYHSINVNLFQEQLSLPGSENNIVPILRSSRYCRIALPEVREEKVKHFVDMQKNVWNFGMKKCNGMLGGTFACALNDRSNFLVFSGWKTKDDHQKYMEDHFPDLFKNASPHNDVLNLKGEQFEVEEAWVVLPT